MANVFINTPDGTNFPAENPVPWTVQGTTQFVNAHNYAYKGLPNYFSTPALVPGWTVQSLGTYAS